MLPQPRSERFFENTPMSMINFTAVRRQTLHSEPFDYLVVPDFISACALAQVNSGYPAIQSAANHALEELSCGSAFTQLMDEIRQPAFAGVLGEKFAMALDGLPTTITVRKFCERSDGNIHTDHKSKVLTVLIYFNESWPHDTGQLRLLRSKNDIEDYAAEISPLGGTMLAFRRTDYSWHGHKRFVGERRIVQLNYLEQSPLAVMAQRVSRFGTHFMKNVMRIR